MINNWFYILPFIFFASIFIIAIKKINYSFIYNNEIVIIKNYLPSLIIALYLLSSVLIFFVDERNWYPYFHLSSYTYENFLIYSVFLTFYLIPALYIKPLVSIYEIERTKSITFLLILMSLLGWYSLFYQFPYALKGLALGSQVLREQINTSDFSLLPKSSFTTLAVGISYFYIFYIAFFFISLIQKRSKFITISLLIGSFSYIISGLAFTTRDVFVFYGLSFIFIYLFFKNVLSKELNKKFKILIIVISAIFIFLLILFSYQRFQNSNRSALAYGTIGYIAQQPFVFSETISQQKEFYNGDKRFPLFKSLFSQRKEITNVYPYEWSFGTFIKDLYSEGGFNFLIIFTFIFISFFYIHLRIRIKNFYRKLIINLFYFQFLTMGIFYMKLGSRAGNIYMIILLVLYLVTYFRYGEKIEKS